MSEAREIPPLEEVPGPSALGGGWRRFLDLLILAETAQVVLLGKGAR